MKKLVVYIGFILISGSACTYKKWELAKPYVAPDAMCDTTRTISYAADITPIMNTSCGAMDNNCHTSLTASGYTALDVYAGVNYVALNGAMTNCITWNGKGDNMPLNGKKLSACEINKILKWINEGAPDN